MHIKHNAYELVIKSQLVLNVVGGITFRLKSFNYMYKLSSALYLNNWPSTQSLASSAHKDLPFSLPPKELERREGRLSFFGAN